MNQSLLEQTRNVLGVKNTPMHIMTAQHKDERAGIIVNSLQVCALEPLLICASVRTGHSIEPLIRDSHAFAICLIDRSHQISLQKFDSVQAHDERDDPFQSIEVESLTTGSPVICKCSHAIDCEVVRHFDLDTDHELYIGHVVAVRNGTQK